MELSSDQKGAIAESAIVHAAIKLGIGVVIGGVGVAALLRTLWFIADLGPRPGRGPARVATAARAVTPPIEPPALKRA